nr:hypothetical protein [Tanacetum cinerariifolium]
GAGAGCHRFAAQLERRACLGRAGHGQRRQACNSGPPRRSHLSGLRRPGGRRPAPGRDLLEPEAADDGLDVG